MKDSTDNFYSLTPEDPRFRITPTQQTVAACTGAFFTSLLVTPLDVVKTRLQAQQKNVISNKCYLYCNNFVGQLCTCTANPSSNQIFEYKRPGRELNGTWDALAKISRYEGIKSLWSGLSPTLALAVPATVVYFVTYEQMRTGLMDKYCKKGSPQPVWIPLISGCTARVWAASMFSPIELVRTNMQSKKLTYSDVQETMRGIIKHMGWSGLWRGVGPTLMRDVPFSGIYWVTYEKIKALNNTKPNFNNSFLAGSIAGSLAAFVTTPFDVVKTYRQIEGIDKEKLAGRSSTLSILSNIYKTNGLRGLFAGVVPRIVKVAPACAIMVASFEFGKNFFQVKNMMEYKKRECNKIDV